MLSNGWIQGTELIHSGQNSSREPDYQHSAGGDTSSSSQEVYFIVGFSLQDLIGTCYTWPALVGREHVTQQ